MAVVVKVLQEDVVLQRIMGAEIKQAIEVRRRRSSSSSRFPAYSTSSTVIMPIQSRKM